jgi:hypothetical protein
MAIQITGFSERAHEAMRRFLEEHPVYSMSQVREIEAESPLVRVTAVCCHQCGEDLPLPEKAYVADWFGAVRLTHEYSIRDRSQHCGGAVRVTTARVTGPVAVDAVAI